MTKHLSKTLLLALCANTTAQETVEVRQFDRQIAPLLAARCLECLSGAKQILA
jgi:hypothetical protein